MPISSIVPSNSPQAVQAHLGACAWQYSFVFSKTCSSQSRKRQGLGTFRLSLARFTFILLRDADPNSAHRGSAFGVPNVFFDVQLDLLADPVPAWLLDAERSHQGLEVGRVDYEPTRRFLEREEEDLLFFAAFECGRVGTYGIDGECGGSACCFEVERAYPVGIA